jgi:hypothetical protein
MKKKLLFIFGWEFRWESELFFSLQEHFTLQSFYFQPELKNLQYKKLIAHINQQILDCKIDVVVFHIDFLNNIDFLLIDEINASVKGVLTLDDSTLHLRNSVTCLLARVNFVIVADPLTELKYRGLGLETVFIFLEGSDRYACGGTVSQRSIDVLFVGEVDKADRADIIRAVGAAGVNVRIEGGSHSRLTYAEMIALYQNAKIVLNFAKSDTRENASLELGLYNYVLEFKGRVLEAGLCGALCVTEYMPHVEILFLSDEIPTFSTDDECAQIISGLLSDPVRLEALRQVFVSRCEELRLKSLVAASKISPRKSSNTIKRIPDWYLVPSFVDRFRWALIYRRPADLFTYVAEFAALPIPALRKPWLAGKIIVELLLHSVRAMWRRVRTILRRP